MINLKIEYIREFQVLATEMNFSLVARKLFISQSVLSRHIASLENEIGVPLLKRSTHYVELTEVGKLASATFQEILQKYDNFLTIVDNNKNKQSGKLKVGILYYSLDPHFTDFIPIFKKKYPDVDIELRTYQSHNLYQDILKGNIDIGSLHVGDYPGIEQLNVHEYQKYSMVAIMSNNHLLANRLQVNLEELQNEILIELKEDFCIRITTREMLENEGVVFNKTTLTDNVETISLAIHESNGIFLAGEDCKWQQKPQLVYIPLADKTFVGTNAFFYRKVNENPLITLWLDEIDDFFS